MEFGDTPWVDRTWRTLFDRIQARGDVEDSWMPVVSSERPLRFVEYGCGSFGCVSPTEIGGIVVKLTSDVSEARFVAWALETEWPRVGMIRYHKILRVEGGSYKRRPLYVLWRGLANHVGSLGRGRSGAGHAVQEHIAELVLLDSVMGNAREVGRALHRWRQRMSDEGYLATLAQLWQVYQQPGSAEVPKHVTAALVSLQKAEHYIAQLEGSKLRSVGFALRHYLKRGVLLADVRGENVARALGDIHKPLGDWAIIDPSLAIVINPDVEIPEIETV